MGFDVQGYLRSLKRFGMKPGLERIQAILGRLGNPEAAFPAVHIAGTNGKGSVAATTASILRAAGYRVGMFTSPHLIQYHERIQVDGEPIPDEALQRIFERVAGAAAAVRDELGSDPTEFEVGTAAAFLYFQEAGVDLAVVEVGLGGRLDSTNVVQTQAAAITPISYDHMAVLGSTLPSIAREKAGILKPGVPAVIAPQCPEAASVLAEVARDLPCPLVWVNEEGGGGREEGAGMEDALHRASFQGTGEIATYTVLGWSGEGGRFHLKTPSRRYFELFTPLLGYHQVQNAAVAVTLVEALAEAGFAVSESQVRAGLASVRWPGRLELFPGNPAILLDGVHNPAGAEVLALALSRLFPGVRPVFLFALTGAKDPAEVFGPLAPFARAVVATRPASSRVLAVDPEALLECARDLGVPASAAPSAQEALERAKELAGQEGMVCVCGSLYLVGEVRGLLVAAGLGS